MSARAEVDEAAFVRDWVEGVPVLAMGLRYGISDSTVSKVARRMGLPARKGDHRNANRRVAHKDSDRHPAYALTGGQWVPDPRRGIMVWQAGTRPGGLAS